MKQSILIFLAILLGILLPHGHQYTYLIRYTLMIMLFFAFLSIDFRWNILQPHHLTIALLNIVLPLSFYYILKPLNVDIAMAAFVISFAPTAAAAPVIGHFLRTDIPFITASVLITSPLVALILPVVLPWVDSIHYSIKTADVLLPVISVVAFPLLLSLLVKKISGKATVFLRKLSMVSFGLFLFNVWIGCGKATHFITGQKDRSMMTLLWIGLTILIVCVIHFELGKKLGSGKYVLAASLAMGRKNTMFALWISLTFLGPLTALGPIFYILFQNMYNSWQIYDVEKARKKLPTT